MPVPFCLWITIMELKPEFAINNKMQEGQESELTEQWTELCLISPYQSTIGLFLRCGAYSIHMPKY